MSDQDYDRRIRVATAHDAPVSIAACCVFLVILLLCVCPRPTAADPVVLTPHLSVSEQYNDNVFFTLDGPEDYVTSVGTGLSLSYQRPTLSLSLSGGTSAQFFARQTQEDDLAGTQSGTLAASYRASPRLTLTVGDSVTRVSRTRTGQDTTGILSPPPTEGEPGPVIEQPDPASEVSTLLPRGEAFSNSFFVGAGYRLAPRWTSNVSYRNNLSDFSDPGDTDVDHAASLGIGYAWSPTISTSLSYSYSRFDLDSGTDTESHSPALGVSYQFDPTWFVGASVGLFVNRPLESSDRGTSTGPTFDVTVSKSFERSAVRLGAAQQITTSAGIGGVSETRTASLSYSGQLARRLSGSVGVQYSDFNASGTDFRVFTANAGLSFPLWRYVSAGLSYSYRLRDSDQTTALLEQGVVDGNIVQLSLTASYPVWRGNL